MTGVDVETADKIEEEHAAAAVNCSATVREAQLHFSPYRIPEFCYLESKTGKGGTQSVRAHSIFIWKWRLPLAILPYDKVKSLQPSWAAAVTEWNISCATLKMKTGLNEARLVRHSKARMIYQLGTINICKALVLFSALSHFTSHVWFVASPNTLALAIYYHFARNFLLLCFLIGGRHCSLNCLYWNKQTQCKAISSAAFATSPGFCTVNKLLDGLLHSNLTYCLLPLSSFHWVTSQPHYSIVFTRSARGSVPLMSVGEQTENHVETLGTQRRYEQKSFKNEANLKIPLDWITSPWNPHTLLKDMFKETNQH